MLGVFSDANLSTVKKIGRNCSTFFGRPARIFGTTKVAGTPEAPVSRQVFLHCSGPQKKNPYGISNGDFPLPVAMEISDPTDGVYEFRGLIADYLYHVIAYDHTGQYDPVIKMNLIPTVD